MSSTTAQTHKNKGKRPAVTADQPLARSEKKRRQGRPGQSETALGSQPPPADPPDDAVVSARAVSPTPMDGVISNSNLTGVANDGRVLPNEVNQKLRVSLNDAASAGVTAAGATEANTLAALGVVLNHQCAESVDRLTKALPV
jgi:hypothetical protein